MRLLSVLVSVFIFGTNVKVDALNILGLFPYQGKSHFFVFEKVLLELASRGHNLTVVSYFPQEAPLKNYHDIDLNDDNKIFVNMVPAQVAGTRLMKFIAMYGILYFGSRNCLQMMENENVQNLWKNEYKFDLVLVEQFNTDCSLGMAYKLGAPVVGLTSHVLMPWQYERFGVPNHPAYVPHQFLSGGTNPSLFERVERTLFLSHSLFVYKYFSQYYTQYMLSYYFEGLPWLEDLAKDIKFMLLYQKFPAQGSWLLPANVIEVGGYHVDKVKPLPEDLKKFIEDSEHGVIYISFGSMLKASTLSTATVEAIVNAISRLPQRAIFKWDGGELTGRNPEKIFAAEWLPQNDILAHPNVIAFYSHSGMLGTTEAIHHGVPMVAMPAFGDQPSNAAAVAEYGLGVQIFFNEVTEDLLLEKFKTVLDPGFRENVKLLSRAWHDRPLSAMDTAIYWIEYAAKYKKISLRNGLSDVPLYQWLYLDVIAVLLLLLAVVYGLIVLVKLVKKSKSKSSSDQVKNIKSKKHK